MNNDSHCQEAQAGSIWLCMPASSTPANQILRICCLAKKGIRPCTHCKQDSVHLYPCQDTGGNATEALESGAGAWKTETILADNSNGGRLYTASDGILEATGAITSKTRMVQLPATAAIEYVAACCITRTRTITKTVLGPYVRFPKFNSYTHHLGFLCLAS